MSTVLLRWCAAIGLVLAWVLFPLESVAVGMRDTCGPGGVARFVRERTRVALKGKWRKSARKIADTILTESDANGFDPLLVMALIDHESRFRPLARGSHGEIGLMQVKPSTGKWAAKMANVRWRGRKTLEDPSLNIRIGTAYLAHVRNRKSGGHRDYLTAYNAGVTGSARIGRTSKYPDLVLSKYQELVSEYPMASTSCGVRSASVLGKDDAIQSSGTFSMGEKLVLQTEKRGLGADHPARSAEGLGIGTLAQASSDAAS